MSARDRIQQAADEDYAEDVAQAGDPCDLCRGQGGWTWTVEYQGREVETDDDCPACGGSGRVL